MDRQALSDAAARPAARGPSLQLLRADSPFASALHAAKAAAALSERDQDGSYSPPQQQLIAAVHSSPTSLDGSTPASSETTAPAAAGRNSTRTPRTPVARRLLGCLCVKQPRVVEHQGHTPGGASASWTAAPGNSRAVSAWWSRSLSRPLPSVKEQESDDDDFSDAGDWSDARSQFSALSTASSDPAAKLEELSLMLRDAPLPLPLAPSRAPWIPEPPLAFAAPGMTFVPVPPVTGFAAYWERDPARSTPYPTPIDVMCKASALVHKVHASIPGIWLQETAGAFSLTVKPSFMPPGLPRYTEEYDKRNATVPSWSSRRDLRLGSTSGQIYFATGPRPGQVTLILRASFWPVFGGRGKTPDCVMEEYLTLEEGGDVIVDRQCCVDRAGARCTQLLVGRRHAVPPKGAV